MDDDRFLVADHRPAYLDLLESGELEARAAAAERLLADCDACPRDCRVDRTGDGTGECRVGARARVASAGPHHGEEGCLSGRRGSGTIFFARCNLHCVFCQNRDISQTDAGRPSTPAQIADIMLELQGWGCHNINLVSPSHVAPQAVLAIREAAGRELRLPVVWNSNAYDDPDTLRLLEGLVDVYMPDFKFWEPATAVRLCGAEDYPGRARAALREMHRQVGDLKLDAAGLARSGLLVRHLVMPGLGDESAAILRWLGEELSVDTYVNVMEQYHPAHRAGDPPYADIARRPTAAELAAARNMARNAGLWRFA